MQPKEANILMKPNRNFASSSCSSAFSCEGLIAYRKNLLTASYVDDRMKGLKCKLKKGLLFLCEMGLDPGIDHMSAKKIIDEIQAEGGKVISFISHCGGLVAPESDDNPWHYKISWNPRNVVMAGKAGAVYQQNGEEEKIAYEELFEEKRKLSPRK